MTKFQGSSTFLTKNSTEKVRSQNWSLYASVKMEPTPAKNGKPIPQKIN